MPRTAKPPTQPTTIKVTQVSDLAELLKTNPTAVRQAVQRERAKRSLHYFVQLMWPVLHPDPQKAFVDGWAIKAICDHVQALAEGRIKKLLICVPPGFSKSMVCNVFMPAWVWGPYGQPGKQFITWSYAEELTIRDNRRCRDVIESDKYQELWGDRFKFVGDQNAKSLFETDAHGWKLAQGIGGGATGHRADFCGVDDGHKVQEAESDAIRERACYFFTETLPTRKNNEHTAQWVIGQRVHERDIPGVILAAPNRLGYEVLCIPMRYEVDHPFPSKTSLGFVDPRTQDGELAWPERFSEKEVAELEATLGVLGGSYAISSQLQQRPTPRGGGMFRRDDFRIIDAAPTKVLSRVRGWDFASSTDSGAAYTASVRMAMLPNRAVVIEDVTRARLSPGDVEGHILRTAEADGYAVAQDMPQDPGQAGKHQAMAFGRLLHGYTVRFSPETGDKIDRAKPLAAQVELGNVSLVRAPWNATYLAEAAMFGPRATYKDQIDASTRAYAALLRATARPVSYAAPKVYT